MLPKVLFIEDDAMLRQNMSALLREQGIDVSEANDLAEARELLSRFTYALAIVDGFLPDGSGYTFCEELKALDSNLRVLFMSSHYRDVESLAHLINNVGIDCFLNKPVSATEMVDYAQALLGQKTAPSQDETVVEKFIREKRTGYIRNLVGRLSSIDELLKMTEVEVQEERAKDIRALVHVIRGSAGTYGLEDVSDLASRWENLLVDRIQGRCSIEPEFEGQMHLYLDAIKEAMQGPLAMSRGSRPTTPTPDAQASHPPQLTSHHRIALLTKDPSFHHDFENNTLLYEQNLSLCTSHEEVLRKHKASAFDVIYVDAECRGYTQRLACFSEQLSAAGAPPSIFMLTTDTDFQQRIRAARLGANNVIEKPVSLEELIDHADLSLRSQSAEGGRILVVDDDPTILQIASRMLSNDGFEVMTLASADNLMETLEHFSPDLLLCDVMLPKLSGLNICRALRMDDMWKQLPVLLMTASADRQMVAKVFGVGANDYIQKPILHEELSSRINNAISHARRFKNIALTDPLTGLPNRRAIIDNGCRSLSQARRRNEALSLVLIDLDHFKAVNDTFGHAAGDAVLTAFASFMRESLRLEDVKGRWGGEEFLVIMPQTTRDQACAKIQSMLDQLKEQPVTFEGQNITISFSAGVASLKYDGDDWNEIVSAADEAMYRAKSAGRGRVALSEDRLSNSMPSPFVAD